MSRSRNIPYNYTVDVTVAVTVTYTFLANTERTRATDQKGVRGVENNTRQRWLNLSVSLVLSPVTQAGLPPLPPLQKLPMSSSPPLEVTLLLSTIRIFPLKRICLYPDKSIIVWQLTRDEDSYGYPKRILHGHNHFVSDVVISSDGQFALSSSWDHTLRLWDLNTGLTTRRFVGHTSDVLSVSFSADNRQIVSGSRDRSIKLWNTLGECKYDIKEDGHTEWYVNSFGT